MPFEGYQCADVAVAAGQSSGDDTVKGQNTIITYSY